MYFEYTHWDVWHEDFPEQKLTGIEAMDKRGAGLKGCVILKRQRMIPFNADKRRMMVQESN